MYPISLDFGHKVVPRKVPVWPMYLLYEYMDP